jgi:hypothetical protein
MASGGERTAVRPINCRPSATTAHGMCICSYPDDLQAVGQPLNWTRIMAEAVQVLRENPHMFDISEAYNLVSMNETPDGGADDGMADMERQFGRKDLISRQMTMSQSWKRFLRKMICLQHCLEIKSIQVMMKALVAESPSWYHALTLPYHALTLPYNSIGIIGTCGRRIQEQQYHLSELWL